MMSHVTSPCNCTGGWYTPPDKLDRTRCFSAWCCRSPHSCHHRPAFSPLLPAILHLLNRLLNWSPTNIPSIIQVSQPGRHNGTLSSYGPWPHRPVKPIFEPPMNPPSIRIPFVHERRPKPSHHQDISTRVTDQQPLVSPHRTPGCQPQLNHQRHNPDTSTGI